MQAPTIWVVLPPFDRPGSLDECLRALAGQTLDPSRFEVIVSDDGSPVPVAESLRATLNVLAGREVGPGCSRREGGARGGASSSPSRTTIAVRRLIGWSACSSDSRRTRMRSWEAPCGRRRALIG